MINWDEGLNEHQRAAANQLEGPMLILAGAGSGKTKTMTHRICHLIQNGVAPEEILAITFTNKAAKEMQERVNILLAGECPAPLLCTFHSFGYQIVRKFGTLLGYRSHVSICDEEDSKKRIANEVAALTSLTAEDIDFTSYQPGFERNLLSEINLFLKSFQFENAEDKKNGISFAKDTNDAIIAKIRKWKDDMVTPSELNYSIEELHEDTILALSCYVYNAYEIRKRRDNVLDFDDLIEKSVKLLKTEEVAEYYNNTYKYIMVDEFQDTSVAQNEMVRLLAQKHNNICVVGDDYQSIYAFRGAVVDNILKFDKTYKGCNVYTLGENYRSTQNIVDGSYSVILNNKKQAEKKVFSVNEVGDRISIREFSNGYDEAQKTIEDINLKIKNGASPFDFAILYRNNATSRSFEQELLKCRIPYKIYGGLPFFSRREVKDVISLLKVICGYQDSLAFERIINVPRKGLGPKTLAPLFKQISNTEKPILDVLQEYAIKHPKFEEVSNQFIQARDLIETSSISELITHIIKIFDINTHIENISDPLKPRDFINRIENIREIASYAEELSSDFYAEHPDATKSDVIDAFFENVALLTDTDKYENDTPTVSLMTMHQSKGLEFKEVYVVACQDDERMREGTPEEIIFNIEEARRLFYVAMTRAKEKLILSYADKRNIYGTITDQKASSFLKEIPYKNKQIEDLRKPDTQDNDNYYSIKNKSSKTNYYRKPYYSY